MASIRKYFITGDSRYFPDAASFGPLSAVLYGVGGGQRMFGHNRSQPPLQETKHPPDASLGAEHLDPEDAWYIVHEGPQTGTYRTCGFLSMTQKLG